MKKLSLLVGTLGGAFAGYLFSNKKLRDQLSKAKDPEEAAKLLGKHLQRDGKRLAAQAREFIDSEEVQKNVGKAKKFASAKAKETQQELNKMIGKTTKAAKKKVSKGKAAAKKAVTKAVKRKPSRMQTKTRTLS